MRLAFEGDLISFRHFSLQLFPSFFLFRGNIVITLDRMTQNLDGAKMSKLAREEEEGEGQDREGEKKSLVFLEKENKFPRCIRVAAEQKYCGLNSVLKVDN